MKKHCVTVTKIKWASSTGRLKDIGGVLYMEKSGWHSPKTKKIRIRESTTFTTVTNKWEWNSSTNKTETSKSQTGKQVFETERDC